jgi:hypothetical protein
MLPLGSECGLVTDAESVPGISVGNMPADTGRCGEGKLPLLEIGRNDCSDRNVFSSRRRARRVTITAMNTVPQFVP